MQAMRQTSPNRGRGGVQAVACPGRAVRISEILRGRKQPGSNSNCFAAFIHAQIIHARIVCRISCSTGCLGCCRWYDERKNASSRTLEGPGLPLLTLKVSFHQFPSSRFHWPRIKSQDGLVFMRGWGETLFNVLRLSSWAIFRAGR